MSDRESRTDPEQQRVVRRIGGLQVRFGGPHEGWLPSGAATPPSTEGVATLNLEIVKHGDRSYSLNWESSDPGLISSDTWHETLEDALHQAEFRFGIGPDDWEVG